ncbi:MAG: DUF1987 domain-containing protein [Opitutales bacterium]
MQTLDIAATRTTPGVIYDPAANRLSLTGQSYPENSFEFYGPIKDWLEELLEGQPASLLVEFRLDYFNTSSSKCLLDILERLEAHHQQFGNIAIRWYYDSEDEDMEESGQDFGEDLELPFELVPCES